METSLYVSNPSLNFSEIVSSIALATSIFALGWNVVRDLIKDRMSVDLLIAFGEIGNVKNSASGLFAVAGSLKPDHKFDSAGMLVRLVNTGKKPICIEGVGGKYTDGTHFSIVVSDLPKMLQPYETFSSTSNADIQFIQKIHQRQVKNLWALDTTGEKWHMTPRGWGKLRQTASYIALNKHR